MRKQFIVSVFLTCFFLNSSLVEIVSMSPNKCYCVRTTKVFPTGKKEILFERICGDYPNGVVAAQTKEDELKKMYKGAGISVVCVEVGDSHCN